MKTKKTATKSIVCTTAYSNFLVAFTAEGKAVKEVSKRIDVIEKIHGNANDFYRALFAEGYVIPKGWKKSSKGVPLAASTGAVKNKLAEVGRLVSALDMRKMRAQKLQEAKDLLTDKGINFKGWTKTKIQKEAEKLATETVDVQVIPPTEAPEAPEKSKVDHGDSAPRVETSDEDITFDAVDMIRNLQGFMIALTHESLQLSAKDSKKAHKLAKELIELARNA